MNVAQLSRGGFREDFANVNGVRLHYVSCGAPDRPLIMFVHGFPEFWYEWRSQLVEFGGDYFAVAPDMRGYNLSSKPAVLEQYRMKHLTEDLRALAAHLGYRSFILVGHDWGGAVAWALALSRPDCLERLIIINAPHPAVFARELQNNPRQQKASEYMLLFRSPGTEAMLSADNYARLVSVLDASSEEDKHAYIDAWSQPGALTGGLNYYRASRVGPPSPDGEPATTFTSGSTVVLVPTLVIWGEKDIALLPSNLEGLEEYVPGVRIERFPDATHWVVREKSAEVNRLIRDFVIGELEP